MPHAATKHFSIIDVVVTDDFVERRLKAANGLVTRWRKLNASAAALAKASLVAEGLVSTSNGGTVPGGLRQEVGAEISRHSPTHDADDAAHDFEVAIVASVAALILFESTTTRTEHCKVFAEAVSAAMDMSAAKAPPKVAGLWEDLSRTARAYGERAAEASRARSEVDTSDPTVAVRVLAENGRKDAEEINVLWWTLNDWSALGQGVVSAMPVADASIAASIELATLLKWPAVRAHRHLAHRNLPDRGSSLRLKDLVVGEEALRGRVQTALAPMAAVVSTHPAVFVALTSVMAKDAAAADAVFSDAFVDPEQTLAAWRWCERLVREISLAKSAGGNLGPLE